MAHRPGKRIDDLLEVVSNHPEVLQGQTVFTGTRVPLDTLLAYRRKGRSLEEYLLDFPTVEPWQADALWQIREEELTRMIQQGAHAAR
jgi:uncharacterized protein (DUF433 family)